MLWVYCHCMLLLMYCLYPPHLYYCMRYWRLQIGHVCLLMQILDSLSSKSCCQNWSLITASVAARSPFLDMSICIQIFKKVKLIKIHLITPILQLLFYIFLEKDLLFFTSWKPLLDSCQNDLQSKQNWILCICVNVSMENLTNSNVWLCV